MTTVSIALIVAAAENGVIGRNGGLPWRMPTDLKTFRRLTLGKPVVMGRKTYQSIGKPLDKRDNIVVTRDREFAPVPHPALHVVHDLDAALMLAVRLAADQGAGEVMVIGGAEIYRLALPRADRVYLTRVHAVVEGDATFPELAAGTWVLASREALPQGDADQFGATLEVYEKSQSGPV